MWYKNSVYFSILHWKNYKLQNIHKISYVKTRFFALQFVFIHENTKVKLFWSKWPNIYRCFKTIFAIADLTQYQPLSFYKDADFRGSWEGQYSHKTNFRCFIWIAKMISFHLIYSFQLKKLKIQWKNQIFFEKACTKKCVLQKWCEMKKCRNS